MPGQGFSKTSSPPHQISRFIIKILYSYIANRNALPGSATLQHSTHDFLTNTQVNGLLLLLKNINNLCKLAIKIAQKLTSLSVTCTCICAEPMCRQGTHILGFQMVQDPEVQTHLRQVATAAGAPETPGDWVLQQEVCA